jgi:hypothetical protein
MNQAVASGSHGFRQPVVFISAPGQQRHLLLFLSFVAVFFALQQAGFGFLDYMPLGVVRLLQLILVGGTALLAMLGFVHIRRLPPLQARTVLLLAGINVTYAALSLMFGGISVLFHVESIVIAFAMVVLLGNSSIWLQVVRGLFWGCAVLIVLNTVPLLHWAEWIDLAPEFIPRLIETDDDLSDLDAYSFGIFGRTESYVGAGRFFGRMQGWTLEPLHWGYFVVLGAACGLVACGLSGNWRERLACYLTLPLFAIHLVFVSSASVLLTVVAWLLSMLMLLITRRWSWGRRRETLLLFAAVVVAIGLAIPFALTFIPDIQGLLLAEQVIGKGDNWSEKIEFLNLGPELFVRFLPKTQTEPQASHNLVLGLYLHYGYFLIAPLLAFFYWFLRHAVSGLPMMLAAAGLLILLSHLLLVPPAIFYPSGAVFLALALVAADYYRRQIAAPPR